MANQYDYFDGSALLFFVLFAGVALIFRIIRGLYKKQDWTDILVGCLETVILTFIGGFLARSFILYLWKQAHDPEQGSALLFAIFFQLPGIAAFIAKVLGAAFQVQDALLLTAAVVGCFIGMMDGVYSITYKVSGHVMVFPLDVTWGLCGSTYACLVHIIDTFFGEHQDDGRQSQHRYDGGFTIDGSSGITFGNVISNLPYAPGTAQYTHETFHVWTNRIFGPLYIWSYLVWFTLFGIVIGSIIWFAKRVAYEADSDKEHHPKVDFQVWFKLLREYGYYNNPWETIAYAIGGTPEAKFVWNVAWVIILAILFYPSFVYAAYRIVQPLWL